MAPDYSTHFNTSQIINSDYNSVRRSFVVIINIMLQLIIVKFIIFQNVQLFCILLTSFLLFILLPACGECTCCCKMLRHCRATILHIPHHLQGENMQIQGHQLG